MNTVYLIRWRTKKLSAGGAWGRWSSWVYVPDYFTSRNAAIRTAKGLSSEGDYVIGEAQAVPYKVTTKKKTRKKRVKKPKAHNVNPKVEKALKKASDTDPRKRKLRPAPADKAEESPAS